MVALLGGASEAVMTGPFELLISFDAPMTGFEQSDLKIYQLNDDIDGLITGWRGPIQRGDAGLTDYYATITPKKDGYLTFHVPADVALSIDGGLPNVDVKLLVSVKLVEGTTNRPPAFASESTTRSVAENTGANVNIGSSITATDPDADTLTYSLSGTDAAAFSIDSSTGQLRTRTSLDYETKNIYTVRVNVSDGNGGTDSIAVTINVTDVDEIQPNASPVFIERSETTRSVAENTPSGVSIGSPVSATDADNDPLTYSLSGTDAPSFRIASGSGQLRTHAALDFETKDSYSVTVLVLDNKDGSNFIRVTINVTDVNEAPSFTSSTATRSIPENTAANQNIGTPVTATDPDGDSLTYSLSGTDAASFGIVSGTGQLRTSAALDFETKNDYSVRVIASDGRGGTNFIDVTINLTNVNEAPMYSSSTATRSIAENTAANQNIGTPVTATDPDGDNLTYSLSGTDAASFGIVSGTGQLRTSAALDFETKNNYSVRVTASDGRGDTDSINVTINVTDVDEAPPNRPPVFAADSTTRSIGETTKAGVKIGAPVTATDPDKDTLTYSLEGTDAAAFSIDSKTGQLKTKAALNRGVKSEYTVTVKADDGEEDGTDTITVTIKVLKPDRPDVIMFAMQDGVEEWDQVVKPGTFKLGMSFGQPVTGFEQADLTIKDDGTGATIIGWQKSNGGEKYTATIRANSEGGVTFTVPENAAEAADDGQGNVLTMLSIYVTESGEFELGAPTSKGSTPPSSTLLLANYPNPSNPETWIPYQLAKSADITITIYNMRGIVVRRLALGHQSAGFYTNRTRAAHWDGRNELGETVSNSVYFYQLRAGDISPPRKMLMLK